MKWVNYIYKICFNKVIYLEREGSAHPMLASPTLLGLLATTLAGRCSYPHLTDGGKLRRLSDSKSDHTQKSQSQAVTPRSSGALDCLYLC